MTESAELASKDDSISFLVSIVFPVSSLAGLANLLRSDREITWRLVCAALLNAGMFGVAIGAVLRHKYGADYDMMTLGISILAGLGGNALLDFAVELFKSFMKERLNKRDGDK